MIHLVTHTAPDGDALGAVFAVRELLERAGQDAQVHLFGDLPRWFPAVHELLGTPPYTTAPVTEGPVWLFDAQGLSRCGEGNVAEDVALNVLIDHHPDEGTQAHFRAIHPEMSSTCEMLARIALPSTLERVRFNARAAGWLYLGLRTDTLAFSTETTSVHTHDVASALIHIGAPHHAIAAVVHRSMTRQQLGFQSWLLGHVTWYGDAMILSADQATMDYYGVNKNDVKVVFGPAGQLVDVGLVALLIEMGAEQTIISLRSPGSGRAQAIARRFGGGGHPSAAGANVARSLGAVRFDLLVMLDRKEVA